MDGRINMDGIRNNPPRNLKESAQFTEQKNKLLDIEGCKRLDDILAGLDIALCRAPDRYPIIVKGTDLRMFKTLKFPNVPAFKIWYRYDEEAVELVFIEKVADE